MSEISPPTSDGGISEISTPEVLEAVLRGQDLQGVIEFDAVQALVEQLRTNSAIGQSESLKALISEGRNVGNTMTNSSLFTGDFLQSDNGRFTAVFQEDGNFVVYDKETNQATWNSGTHFNAIGGQLAVQSDGNLVVYDHSGEAEWNSETYSTEGSVNRSFTLAMQDDGNLVIYDDPGVALWSSQHGKLGEAQIKSESWTDLEALEYIATYDDLIDAYGADPESARMHYGSSGEVEGRTASFSAADYLAANPDVAEAVNGDLEAGARHYIETGRDDGRTLAPEPNNGTGEPNEGVNDPPPNDGGDANPVDRGKVEDLSDRANALYYQVMDMNMDFQENTAGGKVGKDQSGKVTS